MDDHFHSLLLEDLETLDSIERRYRFYKGTIQTLIKLLRTELDSATGRNHALTAAENVLAAVRLFAFGNRQINVGDLHSISQPSTSRAITDVARALAELRPQYIYLPQTEDERMQFGLAIHQNDHQARRRFVEWAQNEIAVVPDFRKRILFSDEVHFWLNGYVNKQNCRIWSESNPQVYVETPLHPEKLTVWCALWAGGILLQKR
ncbi:putative DD41D transposase [Trichonephila clavipes]|nr:putative DD41D transposase [Trichonephila clavipes]